MTAPRASIVLPVYNQADHIATVVEDYEAGLDKLPWTHETILVPNGCRDASVEICNSLARRFPSVRVHEIEGSGWGRAVLAGLGIAQGDVLCYTNSARTKREELVLVLVYALANPGVVVKANRKIRESLRRRLGSLIYNLECRALFDFSYWDVNGTPKVFPRTLVELTRLTRMDDLIDLEFCATCREKDYPVLEVPIVNTTRRGGKSTTNLRSAARMYVGAWRLWKARRARTPHA